MKPAIIVVDMLKDSFIGRESSSMEEYLKIVPRIKELIDKARILIQTH